MGHNVGSLQTANNGNVGGPLGKMPQSTQTVALRYYAMVILAQKYRSQTKMVSEYLVAQPAAIYNGNI